jgi:hypothetical protein
MKNTYTSILMAVLAVFSASILVARATAGGARGLRRPQWQYAVFYQGPGACDSHEPGKRVNGIPASFFREMGLPGGVENDVRTGTLEAKLLNRLGEQGWELVCIADGAGRRAFYHRAFWFKRAK